MAYPALPDHRMPYDNDGTLVYAGQAGNGADTALSSGQTVELNDDDQTDAISRVRGAIQPDSHRLYFFFPEQREITGIWAQIYPLANQGATLSALVLTGSNDTSNGEDGTWETASLPGGAPNWNGSAKTFDEWRSGIKVVSFTGPKKNLRTSVTCTGTSGAIAVIYVTIQLYGEAAGGQMAHDLIFLDPDLGAGVAYPAAEDFGDQPLGTTVVRPFRVKNTSATVTAANVNLQCNDADFTIATASGGPWVVTINIASLGPGVESSTMYVRCTTPAPGAALKPRFARIIATCDAGFFG